MGEPRLVLAFHDGGLMAFTAGHWRKMEKRFAGVSIFVSGRVLSCLHSLLEPVRSNRTLRVAS